MAVMQPELQAIQKKYKGKNDNDSMMKMNVETRALYEKYGTSMTGGCLPLLVQLPILLALYQVIYRIPAYVSSVRHYFDLVIAKLPSGFASDQVFTSLAESYRLANADYADMDKVVDLLYKLTPSQWGELTAAFPDIATVVTSTGENVIESVNRMQQFLGINISYTPFNVIMEFFKGGTDFSIMAVIIAFLIPVLSGLTQWYSTKLATANQPAMQTSDDNKGMGTDMMKSMNVTMPLMSVFFCFSFPVGIGIYWVISSFLQVVQQLGVNAYLNKVNIDELIAKNVEKANRKRAKKGLPPTKITNNASQTLKHLQEAEAKEEAEKSAKMEKVQKTIEESTAYYNKNAKPGSLAAKANMVQMYNEKHEKRSK